MSGAPRSQWHQAIVIVTFWKLPRVPSGCMALFIRDNPYLKKTRDVFFMIVFRMRYARTGTHDLNITRFCPSLISETILVSDRPFTDKRNDLHILVRMKRKPGAGLDGIVIPNPERTNAHTLWIMVISKTKVMLCIEPAMVVTTEVIERNCFNCHWSAPCHVSFKLQTMRQHHQYAQAGSDRYHDE